MRNNLKNLRVKKGYSQSRIAKELGITIRQYIYIEHGESKGSVGLWERLRDILEADCIDVILQNDDQ